ncbi:MAG: sulfatase [Phycisphaerales bacterium]|jgi:arylsulfatase A-like enzyme|nr:sulfatase [Phycisphaerales bacterium]MBT7171080.1 sulfatase [Phycisphaerales bacterium]
MIQRRTFLKNASLMAAAAAAPRALAHCGSCEPKPAKKPNILFVLVDDWGWKDASCYGSEFYETPNLDKFAKEAVRFTDGYAGHPVCSPTRAAIMTGNNPVRKEINLPDWIGARRDPRAKILVPPNEDQLALAQVTVAEALKAAGYSTWFCGKWHLGDKGFFPEDQGFDVNHGGHHKGSPPGGYYSPYNNPKLPSGPKGEYLPDRLTDETIKLIKAQPKDKPFLAYHSFYTVHTPIQACKRHIKKFEAKRTKYIAELTAKNGGKAPAKTKREIFGTTRVVQDNAAFASMVYAMDENLGRLFKALKDAGQYDNTIIYITGDNGTLATTGRNSGGPSSAYPLRAGKGWCFEGGIRVPVIIRDPRAKANGTVCEVPVYAEDYYPTIMAQAGLKNPKGQCLDGVSLAGLLDGKKALDRTEPMVWHYPRYHGSLHVPSSAIREGDWKLVDNYHLGKQFLFNLKDDIGETKNLAKTNPKKAAELHKTLHDYLKKIGAGMPTKNPDFKPGADTKKPKKDKKKK